MKAQTTITARIPNDLSGDLATLARALQRSRSWVIAEALREYIIFSALAESERDLIRERTQAGLRPARAWGRVGARKPALTKEQVKLAAQLMQNQEVSIQEICKTLGAIARATKSPASYAQINSPNGG